MRIGGSVFLLAIGAILAFAVNDRLSDVDLTAVGYIVMAAGALGLVWTAFLMSRTSGTVVEGTRAAPGERTTVTRDVY